MSPVIYIKYLEEPRVSSSSWKKKTSLVYTIREGEEKQPMSGKVQELFKKKKKKKGRKEYDHKRETDYRYSGQTAYKAYVSISFTFYLSIA